MNDLEQISAQRAAWITAVNERDPDGYASVLTPDAIWLPPGLPPLEGREAFREWVRPFFEEYEYEFSLEAPEVRITGGWAIERGVFRSGLRPRGGGKMSTHSGAYFVLWRRGKDGQWRIDRYVDVSDMA